MNKNPIIIDKDDFITGASGFLNEIFDAALTSELGEIEIRTFTPSFQHFCQSETEAAEIAYNLCNKAIDVYFAVNSRTGKGGKKENVHHLNAFHAEVDYGTTGHKKESKYKTYEEALSAIRKFPIEPTIINHTGGGFHVYWVLSNPIRVADIGIETLEAINKELSIRLGGDKGTQDISRVLRIPGTFNFKMPDNPRPVTMISDTYKKYTLENFMWLVMPDAVAKKKTNICSPGISAEPLNTEPVDIDTLPVSDRIKSLIKTGNDDSYPSRSEADMAVITALVNKGISESVIRQIFKAETIGDKYRSNSSPDGYLKRSIEAAKKLSDLTEEEMADPLFISGAIIKSDDRYKLNILKFEEYIVRKYKLRVLDLERSMFRYNGKCYELCTDKGLNKLCQDELGIHRNLFTKSSLSEVIHFATGDVLVSSEAVKKDQINYLTMQNGLYSFEEEKLLPHNPNTFTTNLLPFDYDPDATCPRFLQFLDEIFLGDEDKIQFVQEAVGYIFHKSIPTPAVFFLIGSGSNGKSVFINTISNLVGEENTCNVSFNLLSDEKYILQLYQKMLNISGETPHNKSINTDVIKAVTAGDWVTGKQLYNDPFKFRPFAKSFLAMNEPPRINDQSHGMWRRIWVIEFPRKFEDHEMDRQLEYKLSLELSGIFNWALDGYKRLQKNDFALSESNSMKQSKGEYRSSTDSVRSFIQDNIISSGNETDRIKFSDLFLQYENYCQSEGFKTAENKKSFRKILEDLKFKVANSSKDNNQCFIFNVRTT